MINDKSSHPPFPPPHRNIFFFLFCKFWYEQILNFLHDNMCKVLKLHKYISRQICYHTRNYTLCQSLEAWCQLIHEKTTFLNLKGCCRKNRERYDYWFEAVNLYEIHSAKYILYSKLGCSKTIIVVLQISQWKSINA